MGGSVSENHGEVRKHQMEKASSLLCGRGFRGQSCPLPVSRAQSCSNPPTETCGRPSGLDTTSDTARVVATCQLGEGRFRSFTRSQRKDKRPIQVVSEEPGLKATAHSPEGWPE